jgi:hypothetical protein
MVAKRARRTREHIIADLSVNHIEYHALKCGYSVEKFESDYGYDLEIFTYDRQGEFENGTIFVQAKATDHIDKYRIKGGYSKTFDKGHIEQWSKEPFPVILVFYDAQREIGYWTYLQASVEKGNITLDSNQGSFVVHFSDRNVVGSADVEQWKDYKDEVLKQVEGQVKHND